MNILSKNIVKDWGLSGLSEIEQATEASRIGLLLYQAVLVKSLDILSVKEEEELDTLLDKDETTTDDVMLFLKSKIPTFDLLVMEEHQKLKEDLSLIV